MNNSAAHYEAWIAQIAQDLLAQRCPEGILEHIQKHAGPDLQRHMTERTTMGTTDWRIWSASMHNLLAIFDLIYLRTDITTSEKLNRLRAHYRSNPTTRTPEPR